MKIAMLVVRIIAVSDAVGVTTAIMSSPTPAHAVQDMPMCHINKGSSGCTGPFPPPPATLDHISIKTAL